MGVLCGRVPGSGEGVGSNDRVNSGASSIHMVLINFFQAHVTGEWVQGNRLNYGFTVHTWGGSASGVLGGTVSVIQL